MKAHDLARALLAGPDYGVIFNWDEYHPTQRPRVVYVHRSMASGITACQGQTEDKPNNCYMCSINNTREKAVCV